jgi:hypothetical protein
MTITPEPDGSLSLRVIIGVGGGQTSQRDLLELIISSEHIADLRQALASHSTETSGGTDQVPPFPCHIGFCRNAINAANTIA